MPFNRPTPSEILQRLQAEIDTALPGADARLRHTVEGVIARITSMAAHELYGYISWIARQILPDTAELEYLERHSAIWGIGRKAATAATGSVQFTGTNGAVIPAGSIVRRSDNVEYAIDADITIAAGIGTGTITAVTAGSTTNADIGSKLNLVSPVSGVQSEAVVIDDGAGAGLTGGTDTESDDLLRGRIISRIQQPPHGGAAFDYETWAKQVSGVTRAWAYPNNSGLGSVDVAFVMDNKAGTIIPDAAEVATVQAYLETVRPITAAVTAFAPTAVPVDFEIHLNPNTVAVQQAIKAELDDLFAREAAPGGTLYLSRIREAISTAAGEFDHVLVTPVANIDSAFGDIPTIGNYTWAAI